MRVLQILLLTVGLIVFGNALSKVSAQNKSNKTTNRNSNGVLNRNANSRWNSNSNAVLNNYSANAPSGNTNISAETSNDDEYEFNFGEKPRLLKIISTERKITFPKSGELKAQVIEEVGKPFIVRFVAGDDEDLIAQFVMSHHGHLREYFNSAIDPKIRLREVRIEGLPSPLIHMVIVQPGGTDYGFWSTLFGEVNGKIRLLTPPGTVFSWEGGVQIGDLGKGNGVGIAVWNSVWGDNEAHYGAHIYQVDFYHYNKKLNKFTKTKQIKTKQKQESPMKALESLGLGFYKDAVRDFLEFLKYREEF